MRSLRNMVVLAVAFWTAGCGGGGDSSGGGGTISEFAGVYSGTLFTTASKGGASTSYSEPYQVQITNQGEVIDVIPGKTSDQQCTDTPPTFLQGNSFAKNISATCIDPQNGTCFVTLNANGTIVNSVMTIRASASFRCDSGTITASYTATLTKTH